MNFAESQPNTIVGKSNQRRITMMESIFTIGEKRPKWMSALTAIGESNFDKGRVAALSKLKGRLARKLIE